MPRGFLKFSDNLRHGLAEIGRHGHYRAVGLRHNAGYQQTGRKQQTIQGIFEHFDLHTGLWVHDMHTGFFVEFNH